MVKNEKALRRVNDDEIYLDYGFQRKCKQDWTHPGHGRRMQLLEGTKYWAVQGKVEVEGAASEPNTCY